MADVDEIDLRDLRSVGRRRRQRGARRRHPSAGDPAARGADQASRCRAGRLGGRAHVRARRGTRRARAAIELAPAEGRRDPRSGADHPTRRGRVRVAHRRCARRAVGRRARRHRVLAGAPGRQATVAARRSRATSSSPAPRSWRRAFRKSRPRSASRSATRLGPVVRRSRSRCPRRRAFPLLRLCQPRWCKRSRGRPRTRSPRAADARGFQPASANAQPMISRAPPIVVGVTDEDHVVRPHSDRVEHGSELLGPVEAVGEHRDIGIPSESRELGPAPERMLVRAHRPSIESRDQLLDSREWKRERVVVVREVVVDLDAQPLALDRERVPERDLLGRNSERDERRDERGIGVEQRAVEVEDRNDRHGGCRQDSRGVITDDRLDRPRNSPLVASSSQRAPQVRQAQESRRREARYSRSTSNELQYGH